MTTALDGICRCDMCRVAIPLPATLSPREVGSLVRAFERAHATHAGSRVTTPLPPSTVAPIPKARRGCGCSMCMEGAT